MKYHVSKKELKENYYRIIGVGYCAAQYLLNYENADSYCAGVYGWACDNYDVNGVLISTGYNYINNKNTKYDYALLQEYDNKAREIVCNYQLGYEVKKAQVESLLLEFVNKCQVEK